MSTHCSGLCNPCTAKSSWMQTIRSILCISFSLTIAWLIMPALILVLSFLSSNYGPGIRSYVRDMLEFRPDEQEHTAEKDKEHSTSLRKRSPRRPFGVPTMELIILCSILEFRQEGWVINWPGFSRFCGLICKCGDKGFAEGTIISVLLDSVLWTYKRLATRFGSQDITEGQIEL